MDEIRTERFPFRAVDCKAGEAWLNGLGAQGWRLEGTEKGRLRFRRTAAKAMIRERRPPGRREG